MLVLSDKLYASSSSLRNRCRVLIDNFEDEGCRSGWRKRAELPLTSTAQAVFLFADARAFHSERHARSNGARNLEFTRRLYLQGRVESHLQVALGVFGEDSLECLLEQRRVEGIAHDHVATCRIAALTHLQQPSLVEGAGIDVDDVTIGRCSRGETVVVLGCFFHELGVVLLNVMMGTDRLAQIVGHDHTGPLGTGTTEEQHYSGVTNRHFSGILECHLLEKDSNSLGYYFT